MSHIIIEEEYRDTFEDVVSEWLQNGYLPLGGVSTYVDRDGYHNPVSQEVSEMNGRTRLVNRNTN